MAIGIRTNCKTIRSNNKKKKKNINNEQQEAKNNKRKKNKKVISSKNKEIYVFRFVSSKNSGHAFDYSNLRSLY